MYLHLGEDTIVLRKDVVSIIDLDGTTTSKITRDFLRMAEEKGKVINVTRELPKSAVICKIKGTDRVYLSQLSPATLFKRGETL